MTLKLSRILQTQSVTHIREKNLENIRMLQQIVFTLRILLLEQDLEGLRALMIKNIMKELNY